MIDLHSHSTFSDGSDSPEELALAGDGAGLAALALTDHDSVEGIDRFLAMQPRVGPRLVAGVEISASYLGRSLHVLGLFVDSADARFRARLADLRERRNRRNRDMVARLNGLGIPLRMEQVLAFAPSCLVSRVHVALALASMGAVSGPEEAFRRYLGDGRPGCVPWEELSPGEAAQWISDAGGVPLVAHPGRFAGRGFRWDEAMLDLRDQGLRGFEAWYGDYGPAEQRSFLDLAERTGMLPSGGSDYHGSHKPGLQLGRGRGDLLVPDEVLAALESAR